MRTHHEDVKTFLKQLSEAYSLPVPGSCDEPICPCGEALLIDAPYNVGMQHVMDHVPHLVVSTTPIDLPPLS